MPREHRFYRDEGLSFLMLMRGVWERKYVVAAIAGVGLIAGVAYALLSSPVYESKAFVASPGLAGIAALNVGRGDEKSLPLFTKERVNSVFLASLQSQELRRRFFSEHYLSHFSKEWRQGEQEALWMAFGRQFVYSPSRQVGGLASMTVQASDAQLSMRWLSDYLAAADSQAKQQLIDDARSDLDRTIESLERRIAQARERARKERADEIVRLDEALKVAQHVELAKPSATASSFLADASSMYGSLSYLRGVTALKAQLSNLRERAFDDPFISGLRELNAELSYYKGLNLSADSFQTYRLDGVLEEPETPLKPRKGLIIILSLIGGLLLGVITALLRVLALSATD
ncbi:MULTISPECIES: Wzz/FepE/Etk N-terminal domain-containing protein [unclassified Pseudomonas]|uniref:Wzz/FepE/Etk N-terminal domain-containing protein n=1 Tax=unclassified Pseudomonas TaxID=196821 RepID=UPI0035C22F09